MEKIDPSSFRILKKIGKGSFGNIYLIESNSFGLIAAKSLKSIGSENDLGEFLKEIKIMSVLNRPNIVRFYGYSETEKEKIILMEYASRGSLYQFIQTRQNYEEEVQWRLRYDICIGICRGLLSLHEKGIIHRDFKSPNILLDDLMIPKITDFGMSKIKTGTKTMKTNSFGSLLWKAPETYRGPFTSKSDIYALGVIFWEIATGCEPYHELDEGSIVYHVMSGGRPEIPKNCDSKFI